MKLFSALKIREIEIKNRIVVSPMCEYSAVDGHPQAWHMVHLGSRAVGGAGLVLTEATAVEARGRISPGDTGIYQDSQVEAWKPIVDFIKSQGAVAGIQLAHSGRKGSTAAPWLGGKAVALHDGGWEPVAPSAVSFGEGYALPRGLKKEEIADLVLAFRKAAQRSLEAGFEVVELHGAHGYLLHEFMSPLSNLRDDEYGGSFENRIRLPLEVTKAVREVWPARLPLWFRVSATDWVDGGWDLAQTIELCKRLKALGVDLIDTSTGGSVANAQVPVGPGYQTRFAQEIRKSAEMATGAVGIITEPEQAETILVTEQADVIVLARELLRDPYWPRRAAAELGVKIKAPVQYLRAW